MTEDDLHRQVVAFLRLALPPNAVLHHSSNESDGTPAWYRKRAAKGTRAGWPDLEIAYRGRMIFIELKTKRGRLTPSQAECHAELTLAGAVVKVCRSLEEVEAFLSQLIPLKARLP